MSSGVAKGWPDAFGRGRRGGTDQQVHARTVVAVRNYIVAGQGATERLQTWKQLVTAVRRGSKLRSPD